MDTSDTESTWSLYSDCDCYLCQYRLNYLNLDSYHFHPVKNPWIYYAQCRHGRNTDCRECKRVNCFVRAFRWYTNEHGSSSQTPCQVVPPCNEPCRDECTEPRDPCQPNIGAFASWLDSKYHEYLEQNNACCQQSQQSGVCHTRGRKRISRKGKNKFNDQVRKFHENEYPRTTNPEKKLSMEFIMTPKNISCVASESCHPSANCSGDRQITRSRSVTGTFTISKSCDRQECNKPPVEPRYEGDRIKQIKCRDVSCQYDMNAGQNVQTQYEQQLTCSVSCSYSPQTSASSADASRQLPETQTQTRTTVQESPSVKKPPSVKQPITASPKEKTNSKQKDHVICQCNIKDKEDQKMKEGKKMHEDQKMKVNTGAQYQLAGPCHRCDIAQLRSYVQEPFPDCQQPSSTMNYEQIAQSRPSSQNAGVQIQFAEPCPDFNKPCPSLKPDSRVPCPSRNDPCPGHRPCPSLHQPCPPCNKDIPRMTSTSQYQQITQQSSVQSSCIQRVPEPSLVDQSSRGRVTPLKQDEISLKSNLRDCCIQLELSRTQVMPPKQSEASPQSNIPDCCAQREQGSRTVEQSTATYTGNLRDAKTGADRCPIAVCPCKNCSSIVQSVRQIYPNWRDDCRCPNLTSTYLAGQSGVNYDSARCCMPMIPPNILITTNPVEGKCSVNCPYYPSTSNTRAQNTQAVQFSKSSCDSCVQTSNAAIQLDNKTVPEYALFMKVMCADKLQQ